MVLGFGDKTPFNLVAKISVQLEMWELIIEVIQV